jgi:hypothetical protein
LKPGQSGSPDGKRPGSLHKLTIEARKIVSAKGPAIIRRIAKDAASGDRAAQGLSGALTPAEGGAIVSTLEALYYSRSCIMDGHEQRLQALEQRVIGCGE